MIFCFAGHISRLVAKSGNTCLLCLFFLIQLYYHQSRFWPLWRRKNSYAHGLTQKFFISSMYPAILYFECYKQSIYCFPSCQRKWKPWLWACGYEECHHIQCWRGRMRAHTWHSLGFQAAANKRCCPSAFIKRDKLHFSLVFVKSRKVCSKWCQRGENESLLKLSSELSALQVAVWETQPHTSALFS